MENSFLRTENEISQIYQRNIRTVYRVCFTYLKNTADTEDAVSDTFVNMIKASPRFENEKHEKAWLIRTASNVCKNMLKHWWQKRENLEDFSNYLKNEMFIDTDDILEAVCNLPDKYKAVIYLYYFEGYDSAEIAQMLNKPRSTILNQLRDARKILKKTLGGEFDEEQENH